MRGQATLDGMIPTSCAQTSPPHHTHTTPPATIVSNRETDGTTHTKTFTDLSWKTGVYLFNRCVRAHTTQTLPTVGGPIEPPKPQPFDASGRNSGHISPFRLLLMIQVIFPTTARSERLFTCLHVRRGSLAQYLRLIHHFAENEQIVDLGGSKRGSERQTIGLAPNGRFTCGRSCG